MTSDYVEILRQYATSGTRGNDNYSNRQIVFESFVKNFFKSISEAHDIDAKTLYTLAFDATVHRDQQVVIANELGKKYKINEVLDVVAGTSIGKHKRFINLNLETITNIIKTKRDLNYLIDTLPEAQFKIYKEVLKFNGMKKRMVYDVITKRIGLPFFTASKEFNRDEQSVLKGVFYDTVKNQEMFDQFVAEDNPYKLSYKGGNYNTTGMTLRTQTFTCVEQIDWFSKIVKNQVGCKFDFKSLPFDACMEFLRELDRLVVGINTTYHSTARGVFESLLKRISAFIDTTDTAYTHFEELKELVTIIYGNGFAKQVVTNFARKHEDIGELVLSLKKL